MIYLANIILCKEVFNELIGDYTNECILPWRYFQESHKILINIGLDRAVMSESFTWLQPYHKLSLKTTNLNFVPRN